MTAHRARKLWSSSVLAVIGLVTSATAADWRPFGLQGIAVVKLASAPGMICAATQRRGVFCLDLRAPQGFWVPRGLDGVALSDLWVDPTRPDVMFASNGFRREFPARRLRRRALHGPGSSWRSHPLHGR